MLLGRAYNSGHVLHYVNVYAARGYVLEKARIQYQRQKELLHSLLSREGALKFNTRWVRPSDIGSQHYCEQKVELAYLYGQTETVEMSHGTEGHERLVEDFEKVSLEQVWEAVYAKGWNWVGEIPLIALYQDIALFGVADQILFIDGKPRMIFEFKFSKYHQPFPSHEYQAQTYGLELHQLGFDTSWLFYAIVISPPEMLSNMGPLKALPRRIFVEFLEQELFTHEKSTITYDSCDVYLYSFKAEKAQQDLEYVITYWKQEREPIPTDNPNKCKSCEFADKCPFSHKSAG